VLLLRRNSLLESDSKNGLLFDSKTVFDWAFDYSNDFFASRQRLVVVME
jgi:hypothetical protein